MPHACFRPFCALALVFLLTPSRPASARRTRAKIPAASEPTAVIRSSFGWRVASLSLATGRGRLLRYSLMHKPDEVGVPLDDDAPSVSATPTENRTPYGLVLKPNGVMEVSHVVSVLESPGWEMGFERAIRAGMAASPLIWITDLNRFDRRKNDEFGDRFDFNYDGPTDLLVHAQPDAHGYLITVIRSILPGEYVDTSDRPRFLLWPAYRFENHSPRLSLAQPERTLVGATR